MEVTPSGYTSSIVNREPARFTLPIVGDRAGGPRVCLPCIQDGGKKWPLSLSGLSAPYRELSQSGAIGADLSVGNLVDAKSNN